MFNAVWMICDVGIVATFLRFGYEELRRHYALSRAAFFVATALAFGGSFAVMLLGGPFFAGLQPYFRGDLFEGAKFIAFIQNAAMSALFVAMFYQRQRVAGQSFTIAWSKWLGTSMTVGLSYLGVEHREDGAFAAIFVAICFVFDVWYMGLIYRALRRAGIDPWTRL